MKTTIVICLLLLTIISTTVQAAADMAGTIGHMSGALVVQRQDGTVKVLAPNSKIFVGDLLITAKDSYAQVNLNDGTKMTLRPNSNLRIAEFQFRTDEPKADNMVMNLLKGGFRTVTGLIGKRGNADAYKLRAATATIGIRGTDFTARICATKNCRDEEETTTKTGMKTQAIQPQVIGRVMRAQGELSAKGKSGAERRLPLGSAVYEGDTLITGNKSYAVVAFRDESRVTLQQSTQFHVEQFNYNKVKSEENAILRLLKGGVRVVTGLIGRGNRDNYKFKMSTATIGIRGTGFDAWCNGPCASEAANPGATTGDPLDGAGVYVWSGEVVLVSPGGSFVVALQQAAIIARDTGKPIRIIAIPSSILDNTTPRPDSVPLDMEKLFGADSAGDAGLYVTVNDGNVIVTQGDQTLDLGTGESGFANGGLLMRLPNMPEFMGGNMQINGITDPNTSPDGCMIN